MNSFSNTKEKAKPLSMIEKIILPTIQTRKIHKAHILLLTRFQQNVINVQIYFQRKEKYQLLGSTRLE